MTSSENGSPLKNSIENATQKIRVKEVTESTPTDVVEVPVNELKFTHSDIDSRMAFKNGKSMYMTLDQLERGIISPRDLPPLDICLHEGKYYSISNRRLKVLKWYDKNVMAPCIVRTKKWRNNKFKKALTSKCGGEGIRPKQSKGFKNHATHNGTELFSGEDQVAINMNTEESSDDGDADDDGDGDGDADDESEHVTEHLNNEPVHESLHPMRGKCCKRLLYVFCCLFVLFGVFAWCFRLFVHWNEVPARKYGFHNSVFI